MDGVTALFAALHMASAAGRVGLLSGSVWHGAPVAKGGFRLNDN